MTSPEPYLAAAIQFEPTLFEFEQNTNRLLELTEEAARSGARLIVLPEMATTGYCFANRAEIAPIVEPIPGPTTMRFADIAKRHRCYVVIGMAEIVESTGVYYNSAALVGPNGLIGVYRKVHPYIAEPKWAKDGDLGFPVFDTEIGRIAVNICMDVVFPESARVPALQGADVICFPTNWLFEKCPAGTWIARALENGVYLIAANRWGLERGVQFSGGSCVIDPNGELLAQRDAGDGIVYGVVDPARARDKRWGADIHGDRFDDRQPDTYGDITLSSYRWQDRDFHGLYGIRPLPEGRVSQIVASQFSPVAGDVDGNLAIIERVAHQHRDADLIVFPEFALTGPVNVDNESNIAYPAEGNAIEALIEIAASLDLRMVVGLAERRRHELFNSALLIGPDGIEGCQSKVHLHGDEQRWATPGSGFETFDTIFGRIGILIGYDALFPEASTVLAINGADLIACPSMIQFPRPQSSIATLIPLPPPADRGPTTGHFHLWRERARETSTMFAFANGGAPSMGWSGIFGAATEDDPTDQSVLEGNSPGSVCLTLDTTNGPTRYKTNPIRAKDVMNMRMPIRYDSLQAPNQSSS